MERTDAEKNRILRERANELAKERAPADEGAGNLELTALRLGTEVYALESTLIREIVPLKGLTPLPGVPPFIAGIMSQRGRILSIVNLRHLLGLPGDVPAGGMVVVLSDAGMEFGLVADAIEGLVRTAEHEIREYVPAGGESSRKYLRGIIGHRLILLDGQKLLNDPDLVVHEEIY